MKRTKEMKKEWIAELKKVQNPIRKFPRRSVDLTAELGEVVAVELKVPAYITLRPRKREIFQSVRRYML